MSSSARNRVLDEDDALVRALDALHIKNKKLVKATVHAAPADPNVKIRSWKMDEFKYGVHPSPFPTLARGLFTRKVVDGEVPTLEVEASDEESDSSTRPSKRGKHIIVARGYDKFFNIGEVPWNSWPSIEKYTTGPFHLTLKSNGCIIFIAALSPTQVVVTSKHSIGSREEGQTSHAMKGEEWLHKHLASRGKTIADFAARLLHENLTAVAELCDDSFEEHVLGYPPELTGLHLHGLNRNQAAFSTLPPSSVDAFAEEFGFIKTATVTLDSVKEVRAFTDEAAETGTWRGEAVEGFVVRCKVASSPSADEATSSVPDTKPSRGPKNEAVMHPPYPAGSDYFFKVKFDEPYLMYRAWREITKVILTAKSKKVPVSIPKSRLARSESQLYRDWVEKQIDAHPEDFTDYQHGRGIIETRERFLKWFDTEEGQRQFARLGGAKASSEAASVAPEARASTNIDDPDKRAALRAEREVRKGKLVIVPIAVPGCGKTAVAVALTHLFPSFGHTQSDDVKSKKTAPTFQRNITELLKTRDVVIADRNNHLTQHRQGIRAAANAASPKGPGSPSPIRLVALNWSINNLPLSTIHRLCATRVAARGDNHQSLRPSPKVSHEDIIWQFMSSLEELGDNEVDSTIEMDVAAESLESAVTTAVDGLLPVLSRWVESPQGAEAWVKPTQQRIQEACDLARGYKVALRKEEHGGSRAAPPVRYYAFLPEFDVAEVVESQLASSVSPLTSGDVDIRAFWSALKEENRLTRRPHITIVHKQNLPAQQDLWDTCASLDANKASPALFSFKLGTLLCDGQVMSITVNEPTAKVVTDAADEKAVTESRTERKRGTVTAETLLESIPKATKLRYHITVGTKSDDIRPFEGGKLVERWKSGGKGIVAIPLEGKAFVGRLRGLAG